MCSLGITHFGDADDLISVRCMKSSKWVSYRCQLSDSLQEVTNLTRVTHTGQPFKPWTPSLGNRHFCTQWMRFIILTYPAFHPLSFLCAIMENLPNPLKAATRSPTWPGPNQIVNYCKKHHLLFIKTERTDIGFQCCFFLPPHFCCTEERATSQERRLISLCI